MKIQEKEQIQKDYYKWLEDMRKKKNLKIKDTPLAVINFLDNEGLLKEIKK
jgi:hypothetical protein